MVQQKLHSADEYYNKGVEQYFHKCYQGAIDNFTLAIELEPDDSDILFGRGLAKLLLHQNREALPDLIKAMDLGEIIPQKYLDACGWVTRAPCHAFGAERGLCEAGQE